MKILVTGGAGFVGSDRVDALVLRSHGVRVLAGLEAQVHGAARRRPAYLHPAAERQLGDVRQCSANVGRRGRTR